VRLTATDPSTQRDIVKFCEFLGHHLLDHKAVADRFVYRVRKAD
jgi:tRNA 2-thiouridine synthesizing protein A